MEDACFLGKFCKRRGGPYGIRPLSLTRSRASSGVMLSCGLHQCPSKCHPVVDHSNIECRKILEDQCPQSHLLRWQCWKDKPDPCPKCEKEAKERENRKIRDHELEQRRKVKEIEYRRQLEAIDEQIRVRQEEAQDRATQRDRDTHLQQRLQDLRISGMTSSVVITGDLSNPTSKDIQHSTPPTENGIAPNDSISLQRSEPMDTSTGEPSTMDTRVHTNDDATLSSARDEWDRQKSIEGAENESLDKVTEMIGLEEIKQRFLDIKAKAEMVIRQGADMKNERFGAVLLGNPGTGKVEGFANLAWRRSR